MTFVYLGVEDVLAFHQDQLERFGGAKGVRDMGQLQSALFRPQTGYYQDLIEEAAALWESMMQNHPFVDGNKRIAAACFLKFLQQNNMLFNTQNQPIISNDTLASLTLFIASSQKAGIPNQ